ncbi:MAG TPA: Tim44-like domain-containing protein [Myxococcota bacterium]
MSRWVLVVVIVLAAGVASARIGGGQSYSAPRDEPRAVPARTAPSYTPPAPSYTPPSRAASPWSSSSPSTRPAPPPERTASSGGASSSSPYQDRTEPDGAFGTFVVMFLVFVVFGAIAVVAASLSSTTTTYSPSAAPPPRPANRMAPSQGDRGRRIDPGFVEVLFLERAVLMATRLLEAAPHARLLRALSPYIDVEAAQRLAGRHVNVADVVGVVVARAAIADIASVDMSMRIDVELHLNRHVLDANGAPQSFWSHERWTFVKTLGPNAVRRDDDVLDRFGCPRCGSPLEEDTSGRCTHCQTALHAGDVDWAVQGFAVFDEKDVGPVLTQNVVEVGTDDPSVTDATPLRDAGNVIGDDGRKALLAHARAVFTNLQAAWSAQDLDAIRPFETDALFQSHRCWVEEYKRQGLRNVVGNLEVGRIQTCRVIKDGPYVVAVLRIAASCTDATFDRRNALVAGSPHRRRHFTEYWTFVKHTGSKGGAPGGASLTTCPGCGAPLSITQAGICTSCDRKITLGRFDWVVSRIEQDEEVARAA